MRWSRFIMVALDVWFVLHMAFSLRFMLDVIVFVTRIELR